jgi:hypothetical protein
VTASGVSVSETSVATRSPGLRPSGEAGAGVVDDADQHAAGAGDRIVHLAPRRDDPQHLGADGVAVAAVRLPELAEARGVQVETLDADPDLVLAQRRVGVQAPGRLGQHAAWFEHAVEADRRRRCRSSGHAKILLSFSPVTAEYLVP